MNLKLRIAALAVVILLLYYLLGHSSGSEPNTAQSSQKVDQEITGTTAVVPESHFTQKESESDLNVSLLENHSASRWCSTKTDIDYSDSVRVNKESIEWDIDRGNILLAAKDSVFESPNTILLAPYAELDLQDLIAHAKNDDLFALLTIMQRKDVPMKYRNNAARHLTVMGNTSIALSHLVVIELTRAHHIYEIEGQINEQVKAHVVNSLTYVSYGLEQLDVSALRSYLYFVQRYENGSYGLDVEAVLSEKEVEGVNLAKAQFKQHLNQKREEKYLSAIEEKTFPKVAKHQFEKSLLLEYRTFGSLILTSNNLKNMGYDFKRLPECAKRLL